MYISRQIRQSTSIGFKWLQYSMIQYHLTIIQISIIPMLQFSQMLFICAFLQAKLKYFVFRDQDAGFTSGSSKSEGPLVTIFANFRIFHESQVGKKFFELLRIMYNLYLVAIRKWYFLGGKWANASSCPSFLIWPESCPGRNCELNFPACQGRLDHESVNQWISELFGDLGCSWKLTFGAVDLVDLPMNSPFKKLGRPFSLR